MKLIAAPLLAVALLSGPAQAGESTLSLQPEARGSITPDRVVDIEHLALEVTVDIPAGRVEGAATHRVRPLRDGITQVVFNQVALDITAASVDGAPTTFHVGTDEVAVNVAAPRPAGEAFEIRIEYAAEPTLGLHFRRPGPGSPDTYLEAWSQGEDTDHRHWFPTWDDPSDRFTYEGHFTVPSELTAVSGGVLTGKTPAPGQAGWTTWHYTLDQTIVAYLVALAVGDYERYDSQVGDLPLETYVPPGTGEATAARATENTAAMMELFDRVTGVPYPYPVYRQIFVQRFIWGGMENTTATIMGARLLFDELSAEHAERTDGVVAHELAHQWYGDQLTCQSFRELWLNEGFATFFESLWTEELRGPELAAARTYGRYKHVRDADDKGAGPLVKRFFNDDGTTRGSNPYSKGSSILQMLRVMLGDDVFFRGITLYTTRHQHGLVETEDLRRAMEEVSGWQLDWFFDPWVFLVGHPKLKVTRTVDADSGTLRLHIKQTQEVGGRTPRFTLPIDVEVATTTGSRVERIWMDGAEATGSFPIDGELRWVAIDPLGGLLAEITHEQSATELLAQLGSEHPYAQILALEALKELTGARAEEERRAMATLLMAPDRPRVHRELAAQVLGAWRDDASVGYLLLALEAEVSRGAEGSSRIRQIIADELGAGVPRDAVVDVLRRVLKTDRVTYVRGAALTSLGNLLGPRARGLALTALQAKPTDKMIVHRAAADLLGRWGERSDLGALEPFRRPGNVSRMWRAAMAASIKIAGREPVGAARDDARRPIAAAAEVMTTDLYLWDRSQAIRWLGKVGDDRSIPYLEAVRRTENVEQLVTAATKSIDAIRTRDDTAADPTDGEMEARLKRIEERLDASEESIEELENRP